ncbi:hypothetical protein KSP35_06805 [Aquihabitans sp. G128]|uniref:hypothetical protein n=1 Tax=Aquihabitans sp. G128 TaxID=2849779 RepID=UPI001C229A50|nr:hypothetical protein [Aquihabitans sp. G128]QXC62505.1 hypothetical protein KSP35_06805 [Aquihabitans sp. G128]
MSAGRPELADRLVLVPRPRRLEVLGLGPAVADLTVTAALDPALPAEGFTLTTTEADGARITHADDRGRRYAEALLDQLRAQPVDGRLVAVRVEDHPDLAVRAFMLDVSRDRVPTRATLERFVDLLALARFNQFQLYVEHTFAHLGHEAVWRDASPITAEDLRWLDDRCTAAGIELVVNRNCFGHFERWLRHDAYRHRAEAPDGVEVVPGLRFPAAVLEPTDDNASFALGLLREQLAEVRSRSVNIGCDETFELGRGASAAACADRGKGAVYLEHLHRLVDPLVADGHQVQVWADVLRRHPEEARSLGEGVVPVAWCYEAPRPADEGPDVPRAFAAVLHDLGIDLDVSGGFAANVAPLAEAGLPFWVAPGTSAWSSLIGRTTNAYANQLDAVDVAASHGAAGYLLTDWGDNGHHHPPSISFGPLLHGGAVAWCAASNRTLDVAAVLDRHAFEGGDGFGGALELLGGLWTETGQKAANASPLAAWLFPQQPLLATGAVDLPVVGALLDQLDDAARSVAGATAGCDDAETVRDELLQAIGLARHAAHRRLGRSGPPPAALRPELADLIVGQRAAWLARARPGGLVDSLGHLERTLATYADA